jgi:hypothetical protein
MCSKTRHNSRCEPNKEGFFSSLESNSFQFVLRNAVFSSFTLTKQNKKETRSDIITSIAQQLLAEGFKWTRGCGEEEVAAQFLLSR